MSFIRIEKGVESPYVGLNQPTRVILYLFNDLEIPVLATVVDELPEKARLVDKTRFKQMGRILVCDVILGPGVATLSYTIAYEGDAEGYLPSAKLKVGRFVTASERPYQRTLRISSSWLELLGVG
ncbi:MAG: hypothetical protein QW407_06375 [Thermofilaceae archaeon]